MDKQATEAITGAITGAIKDLVQFVGEQSVLIVACSTACHSLAATHPNPGAALADLLDRMDKIADVTRLERIEATRTALAPYVSTLSIAAAAQQAEPTAD